MCHPQSLLVLVGSPRRSGNSAALAAAVVRGAEQAGARVALRFIDDHISSFLRDCRTCRRADGECAIDDGYLSKDRSEVGVVSAVESGTVAEDDVERPFPPLRGQVELLHCDGVRD